MIALNLLAPAPASPTAPGVATDPAAAALFAALLAPAADGGAGVSRGSAPDAPADADDGAGDEATTPAIAADPVLTLPILGAPVLPTVPPPPMGDVPPEPLVAVTTVRSSGLPAALGGSTRALPKGVGPASSQMMHGATAGSQPEAAGRTQPPRATAAPPAPASVPRDGSIDPAGEGMALPTDAAADPQAAAVRTPRAPLAMLPGAAQPARADPAGILPGADVARPFVNASVNTVAGAPRAAVPIRSDAPIEEAEPQSPGSLPAPEARTPFAPSPAVPAPAHRQAGSAPAAPDRVAVDTPAVAAVPVAQPFTNVRPTAESAERGFPQAPAMVEASPAPASASPWALPAADVADAPAPDLPAAPVSLPASATTEVADAPVAGAERSDRPRAAVDRIDMPSQPAVGGSDVVFTPTAPLAVASSPAGAAAAPAATPADMAVAGQLDLARDSAWLDQLARDIVQTAAHEGELRFRLNPEHLGSLAVEVRATDTGASVRLHAETEQARAALAEAQPRLLAEARAQGLRISDAQVFLGGGQADGRARHAPPQPEPALRTAAAAPEPVVTVNQPVAARDGRYA